MSSKIVTIEVALCQSVRATCKRIEKRLQQQGEIGWWLVTEVDPAKNICCVEAAISPIQHH